LRAVSIGRGGGGFANGMETTGGERSGTRLVVVTFALINSAMATT
jgi:hypothetical protein